MATKSSVRHRPESRIVLVVVLVALLGGGTAGCAANADRHADLSVLPTSVPAAPQLPPASEPARGTAWPSYPLSDQIPSPPPDGWSLPVPPSAEITGPAPDHDVQTWTPGPSASGGPTAAGGGAGGPVTGPSGDSTAADRGGNRRPEGYQRSLVYSGLLGLTIAAIGIGMIGRRRQLW